MMLCDDTVQLYTLQFKPLPLFFDSSMFKNMSIIGTKPEGVDRTKSQDASDSTVLTHQFIITQAVSKGMWLHFEICDTTETVPLSSSTGGRDSDKDNSNTV
jgi:hypothetical protein